MADQRLGGRHLMNVRWANDDPNPKAFIEDLKRAKNKMMQAIDERGLLQELASKPKPIESTGPTALYPKTDCQYPDQQPVALPEDPEPNSGIGPLTKEQIEQIKAVENAYEDCTRLDEALKRMEALHGSTITAPTSDTTTTTSAENSTAAVTSTDSSTAAFYSAIGTLNAANESIDTDAAPNSTRVESGKIHIEIAPETDTSYAANAPVQSSNDTHSTSGGAFSGTYATEGTTYESYTKDSLTAVVTGPYVGVQGEAAHQSVEDSTGVQQSGLGNHIGAHTGDSYHLTQTSSYVNEPYIASGQAVTRDPYR